MSRRCGGRTARPWAQRLFPPQELEQQLMIEKRTYRKTLKFYQKLLQKEKRSKGRVIGAQGRTGAPWGQGRRVLTLPGPPGSEVKTMLSKLKGQLEEMKSKVQFLGLVKKYLQASRPACLHPLSRGCSAVTTLGIHCRSKP